MSAPAAPTHRAMAAPMPLEQPVTITVLPLRSFMPSTLSLVGSPGHRPVVRIIEAVRTHTVNRLIVWRRLDDLGIRVRFVGDPTEHRDPVVDIFLRPHF